MHEAGKKPLVWVMLIGEDRECLYNLFLVHLTLLQYDQNKHITWNV